jgi:cobalt-zinc-cadmium efflux system outer membrane protein
MLAIVSSLLFSAADGQQGEIRAHVFRGKVVQVNTGTRRLVVSNEPIEGWMGAMTMAYAVDKDEVFQRVKAGDRIRAKVYEGDLTLHDVEVVPQTAGSAVTNTRSLRLEDLEQMAMASNPTIAQVQANLRVASGFARQAGLYPDPTVGYYGAEIRGGYTGGGKQGGFVSQTIVLGGKLRAAQRVADLQASETETGGTIQRQRILNNVKILFYQVLAAQRLVEVRQNLAKLAGDATQTSLQLANVGQADRPDVLQAEVEQQRANVSLRLAEQNLGTSWSVLTAVVGKPDLALARLDGDLDAVPELNDEEWTATAIHESPEVKLAQQAVERAEASLVQTRKAPIPDLQLTRILVQNNEPLDPTRKATGLEGGVQIGVQLPIFNRNQGSIAAAKGEIESARQELTRVKLQLQRNLADRFGDYAAARLIVQQYKTEIPPRAEEAYRLYRTNYQNMAGAYPQVLISQRTLFQLEGDYVQALANAWQNALAIRGFGLIDGLAEPVNPSVGTALPVSPGVSTYTPGAIAAQ